MEIKNCPVDVIAMCSAAGDIRPLRLRMEDEYHQLLRIDIDEVISVKTIQKEWVFELRYTIRTHSWCLLRKVY